MKAPQRVNIEVEMCHFVRKFGGTVVEDEVGRSPSFHNADFIFRADSVVAELKCLKNDKSTDPGIQASIQKLYDEYVEAGLIPSPGYGEVVINSKDYPIEFQKGIYRILSRPIKRSLEKANRQIKETKKHLHASEYRGLVLIANDGNYRLEPAQFSEAVKVALGGNFSAIDCVVLFTANLLATLPGDAMHALVWMVAERENRPKPPEEFLNRFFVGWSRHLGDKIGAEIPLVLCGGMKQLEQMKYDQDLSRGLK